jgi:hypothetical protein
MFQCTSINGYHISYHRSHIGDVMEYDDDDDDDDY